MSSLFSVSSVDMSPVTLSYIAALRGVRPRLAGAPFAYAQVIGDDYETLLDLAASNPEGRFFALTNDEALATQAQNTADMRNVANVSFLATPFSKLLDKINNGSDQLPPLDYLVADTMRNALGAEDRDSLFAIAQRKLRESGLFVFRYQAHANEGDALRFVVNETSADMSVEQANSFLTDIKAIAGRWLDDQPQIKAALDQAIAKAVPDLFFSALGDTSTAVSGTFSLIENMLTRGFAFVGDAVPAHNYMELSVPTLAQTALLGARDSLYYEILKDIAMRRAVRTDIWARMPVAQTDELPVLFGAFAFGTTVPRNQIPGAASVLNKYIDLTQPLFTSLLDVMETMPVTIGDFLAYPKVKEAKPMEIIEALQVLIALNIVRPMRTGIDDLSNIQNGAPRWALGYNAYHNVTPISTSRVKFASKTVGASMELPARDALVLQAIGRVGLVKSAGAVFLEMQRIANDPVLATEVFQSTAPTPEMADQITREVVASSLVRWYAYGLLAA